MNKIRKIISLCLTLSVASLTMGISFAGAVQTELTRNSSTNDSAPIIKAKWEMKGSYKDLSGADDRTTAGAQFEAPGVWEGTMKYSICAIATDPNGVDDVSGVYTDIYYPGDRAFHPESSKYPDKIDGGTDKNPDYGLSGCGKQRGDENKLYKLSKTDGYDLFCNTIKNTNNNLPTFYTVGGVTYNYNEICDSDGELAKETAYVYCADKELSWEDPAGAYKVEVFALDWGGHFSNIAVNNFDYLPLTSYEIDFTKVNYGEVNLYTHKRIPGDLTFGTADKPTVRNTGNTRLYMGVQQDDMELGTTDGVYNVSYDARVGSNEDDWSYYFPEEKIWLEDILDLSQEEEMDFSILVTKFPKDQEVYVGTMTLDAKQANFRECVLD